jgi:plasmid stabilization system protein ParE
MNLSVILSPLALDSLISIDEYINEVWGAKSSDKFKSQVEKTLKTLASQPYIFKPSSLASEIRKGIISKQTSFLYQIHHDYIEILFFIDNRQDPIIE